MKYYVVWNGLETGVFTSWEECSRQIKGVQGALYKSFKTMEEAEKAYASDPHDYIQKKSPSASKVKNEDVPSWRTDTVLPLPPEVEAEALAVDAACSGNPGQMEYRGVYLRTGQEVFHYGPTLGTNNIGEFLAIVHALALLKQKSPTMTIYSDSRTAISWVRKKCCKTLLERNDETEELFQLIERAETWLKAHRVTIPIIKWETEQWGEVPADFGRK